MRHTDPLCEPESFNEIMSDAPCPRCSPSEPRAGNQAFRDEAMRTVTALDERHFTAEALEGCVRDFASRIYDLADRLDLLDDVAHRAWHLLDDSGEVPGQSWYEVTGTTHERLSVALDALEATGWSGCDDQ